MYDWPMYIRAEEISVYYILSNFDAIGSHRLCDH